MTQQIVNTGIIADDGNGDALRNAMIKVNANFTDLYNNYQTEAGLAANVATLTSNNTSYVGNIPSANVISDVVLQANLASYQLASTLSANVARMTSNNSNYIGSIPSANVITNVMLQSNLANYQTIAGLVNTLATLTSNNTKFVGEVIASNVVSNSQLQSNLANYVTSTVLNTTLNNYVNTVNFASNLVNYQSIAGLPANVAAYMPVYLPTYNSAIQVSNLFSGANYGNTSDNFISVNNNSVYIKRGIDTSEGAPSATVNAYSAYISPSTISYTYNLNGTTSLTTISANNVLTPTVISSAVQSNNGISANFVSLNSFYYLNSNDYFSNSSIQIRTNRRTVGSNTLFDSFTSNSSEISVSTYNLTTGNFIKTFANSNSIGSDSIVSNVAQITSLGVGTAASGTAGEIRATNDITAFYSDARLKTNIENIENALDKVNSINGVTYNNNELAESFGFTEKNKKVGVIAQEIEKVLPEAVKLAPFDSEYVDGILKSISGNNYKTVQYEKLVPLLIEAIKELSIKINKLENK